MRWLALILPCLLAFAAHAEVQVRRGQAIPAPTQPVTTNNLEAPVFQSDTRNLEAILDKEETARIIREAPPKVKTVTPPQPIVTVPAAPSSSVVEIPEESPGLITSTLTSMRIFAIRWRDLIDISFTVILAIFVRKLYGISRDQHKILSHSIRSAEYSAAAAKRSADICEALLQHQQKPDEAQGRLDL